LGQVTDGQGRIPPFQPSASALFNTDFSQAYFWFTFDGKGFSGNRNGKSSSYQRSPHWFNLRNSPRTLRGLGRLSFRFLEHPRFYAFSQLISLSGIWLYLLLIGMHTPAQRVVFMLSLLVARRLLGQIHQPLYALFPTAFFFIFLNPAVIYEVSFQLSFLAVLFILLFLPLYPHPGENDVYWKRLAKYGLISVAITAAVLLGTWPVVASIFGRLSLKLSG
jgi:ComEC/Rec2-related protein